MIPQTQTKLHNREAGITGNCMMTCYASFFDMPVEECPPIEELFEVRRPEGFWWMALTEWFGVYGKQLKVHEKDPFESGYTGYYFACGPSERGVLHLVIYKDGKLFHDPHPSRAGILSVVHYETIEDIT